jgi:shikimate dehydrogenase
MIAREAPSRLVLLGHPVSHSLSPLFQNAALEACGLPQRYDALDVSPNDLPALLSQLRSERAAGNVTLPHKGDVWALAKRRSSGAERAGAVNTFWFDEGELVGHNTDVSGVQAAIAALLPSGVRGARCTLLGAGGSAAAVLVALDMLGCRDIRVWTRTPSRIEKLAAQTAVRVTACESVDDAVRDASLVVNATPVGLHDDAMPVSPMAVARDAAVLDLVYRREETAWVRSCRAHGISAEDGLRVLVEQGAAAFGCWFGRDAPRDAMWAALSHVRTVQGS